MPRSLLSIRIAGSLLLAVLLVGPARALQESPEEQSQYIAGLCERGLFDVAAGEAEAFLRDHPRHGQADLVRYRLASALFELERFAPAQAQYLRLMRLEDFEFAPEVNFRLGQCQLHAGENKDAARTFRRVTRMNKPYLVLPATFFLGETQLAAGDFAAATQSYGAVLAQPEAGEYARDADYGLVWCAFRLGDSDLAVRRASEFLRQRPGDPATDELRFLLGEAHLARGRSAEALAAYGAVGAGEYAVPALRGAAFARSAAGDHKGAARAFESLSKQTSGGERAGELAGEAHLHAGIEWLHAGEPQRAAPHLRSPAAGNGAEVNYWRAELELELDQPEAALSALDAALGQRPDEELAGRLHALRGDTLSSLGRADEAVTSYRRSGSQYATYAAAVEALNDGRAPQATRLAQGALREQPEGEYASELQLVLGEALLAQGEHASAEAAFRRVLAERPPSKDAPRARLRLGWCRFLQADPEGAATLFERTLSEAPDGPLAEEASYMLGRSREAAGEQGAAVRTWRQYLQRFRAGAHRSQVLEGLARLDTEHGARWVDALLAEGASEGARGGVAAGPAGAQALLELAEREAAAGRTQDAVQRYAEYLQRFPAAEGAARARYGHAWGLYELGQAAEAAAGLSAVAADASAAAETRRSAAELAVWAWADAGDTERALAAYRIYAEVAPSAERLWAAAQVVRKVLAEGGRQRDAGRVIEDFLGRVRTPDLALEALIESAWWALDVGGVDAAEASVRSGVRIAQRAELKRPRLGEACFFVAEQRFEAGAVESARELYTLAYQWGAEDVQPQALYKLGFAELSAERWTAASAAFGALVESYPQHTLHGEALFLLGESEFRAERFEPAASALQRVVREHPRHDVVPKALFRLGLSLGHLERWSECAEALGQLNQQAPEFDNGAEAELWRGRALAALGNRRGARAAFERVLARDKGVLSARAHVALGQGEFAAGDFDAALSQFLRVVVLYEEGDEVAEALLYSGRCLEELGHTERAAEQYRQLLQKHEGSRFARSARARLTDLGREEQR